MSKHDAPEHDSLLQSNKRLKKLTIPKRIKKGDDKLKDRLDTIVKAVTKNEHEYECSLCGEILKEPFPRPLKRLIDTVRKNEREYRQEQEAEYEKLKLQCESDGMSVPPFTYLKGGISKNDQSFICRIHKIELIYKPMAIEKGYPTHIDFKEIDARIRLFETELRDIIDGKLDSIFLQKILTVFKELGATKARQSKQLMERFEETLPGYYGNRGSHFIMETLNKIFLKSDYLNKQKTNPLTPVEYLQQVLVPECGLRLIKQDLNLINLQEASKVMSESSNYGSTVYNKLKNK